MSFAVCCAKLEKLIATPTKESGLGLLFMTNKRSTRFIIEFRKDWKVPVADDAIQITFCPFCGSRLQLLMWSPIKRAGIWSTRRPRVPKDFFRSCLEIRRVTKYAEESSLFFTENRLTPSSVIH
jgi:hypothetical protein